ncbi:benzoate 4-monooxygenase cytochrome P450 [Viridothelium virens]|uniref:Benzoate 4-monooxygenase cytochrome P450 n=1 Tax=Viridothelium virens TaxID=1048519 RepID=A0A6A6HAW1_VIRVR|nr:benzoate 4-monooxygenase cytochrome P450 [Viridothelium virens]
MIFELVSLLYQRLYYHPLAKYPGPFLAKLTDLYAAYYAYTGDLHIKMKEAHDQYGDYVRFGPAKILCNTNTSLHVIYKSKHVKKSAGYLVSQRSRGAWNLFNAVDKTIHARKKRVMRQAFTTESLRRFEPVWLKQIQVFVDLLTPSSRRDAQSEWTAPKDVASYVEHMAIDMMGTVGFGHELCLQSHPNNRYMPHVIAKIQKWTSTHVQSPSLAWLCLDMIFYPQQIYYGKRLLEQVRIFVEERTNAQEAKNDIFSFLVDAVDPETGEHFSITELWSEAKLLTIATGETVAAALTAVLFYLSRNSDSYDRVVNEIRTAFKEARDIRLGGTMDSCTFLHACIKESMRMSPPTGSAPWREVEVDNLLIDGHEIPKGCNVATSIYAIHHKEEYFPDSYSFRPERWLQEDPALESEAAKSAFRPFSLGSRVCIGQGLAMAEIADVLALLLWHLDFRKASDESLAKIGEGTEGAKNGRHRVGEFQMKDHIVGQYQGLFLECRRRQT